MNEAEELLAIHLAELGLCVERQFAYAFPRKFRADFALWRKWHGYRRDKFALIEVQGGIYSRQAHGSVTGILADNERLFLAFLNGWPMIRFTPDQVKDGTAKKLIEGALAR